MGGNITRPCFSFQVRCIPEIIQDLNYLCPLGDSNLLPPLLPPLAGDTPCGAAFFEVRFERRGIPGSVLLREIYVLAHSEPPLQRVSAQKGAQGCPETGSSSLVRGREFRSWRIKKIHHLRCLCIKARSKFRGLFR